MTFDEIKVGDFVHDVGRPIVGGKVTKKLKTRVKVWFATGVDIPYTATYTDQTCRYLRKEL